MKGWCLKIGLGDAGSAAEQRGDPERLPLRTRVITGLEPDDHGVRHGPDAATWEQRRQHPPARGGPPTP